MSLAIRLSYVVSVLVLAVACTPMAGSDPAPNPNTGGASGAPAVGGQSGTPMGGTGTPAAGGTGGAAPLPPTPLDLDVSAECKQGGTPGPAYLRRLTNREYTRTIRALLGVQTDVAASYAFPPDVSNEGYDNNYAALTLSTVHAERYRSAAEGIAAEVMGGTPERRQMVTGCDVATPGCLAQWVRGFARKAFRRVVPEDEVMRYVALAGTAPDPVAGASLVLQALLQSPNFLYRVEVGAPDPGRPGLNKLTGWEMASRLSYFLLMAPPPDFLIAAAAGGGLDTAAGVANNARTLLKDYRAKEAIKHFTNQWLKLYDLEDIQRPPEEYPLWTVEAPGAMRGETERVMEEFVWMPSANLLDVLTANFTWIDKRLAPIYGLMPPSTGFIRVPLTPADNRMGLLGHASFLTLAAPGSEVVAPILRGKFVRDVLLCTPPPHAPPDVPPIDRTAPTASVRQRLAMHRESPSCAACHALLEPLGFGFERYDLIGKYRTQDKNGAALTGEGELIDGAMTVKFSGPMELATIVRNMKETPACVARHLHRFAFGRAEMPSDKCSLEIATALFSKANNNLPELLVGLVSADVFRYVTPGGAP